MISTFTAFVISMLCSGVTVAAHADEPRVLTVDDSDALHEIFRNPVESVHVQLAAGEYDLDASPYTDPTCGNCPQDEIDTSAETTVGLHIRGTNILLSGPENGEAILRTNSGYGLLIEDGENIRLERLVVTGGTRSADSNATDGAIVVRRARVTLQRCIIRENIGEEEVVRQTISGVMGVVGREDAHITVQRCRILRNSWDGIALYRGAQATIENTIVDGMERSIGGTIGGGRGVGIGVTWDARATVRDTLIRRYWKGLGIFVDARVQAERIIVEEIVTWGIAMWGAGDGEPTAHLRNSVVFNTGACGISLAAGTHHEDPGEFTNNAIVRTGQDEAYDAPDRYCRQCPIARARLPKAFRLEHNLLHDNRRVDCDAPDDDFTERAFRDAAAELIHALSQRSVLRDSSFLCEFGAETAGENRVD